jgi:riboflavin kinase / FMN adenylyltransferase
MYKIYGYNYSGYPSIKFLKSNVAIPPALLILQINGIEMIIHKGYENLSLQNPVVTLGIFDGVHRGHRTVIDTLVSRAKEENCESAIITFNPHPRQVLTDNKAGLAFLTSLEEKIYLLEKTGIDHLIIIRFDREFSNREACEFVSDVLVKKIRTKHLIVGFNHHFGRKGEGDFNTIKKCAESFDFNVEQIRALNTESGIISSSVIREALLNGRLEEANRLLGYSYFMNGTVVMGKKLGRKIGYPTANIKPDFQNKLIPKDGVYAVEICFEGKKYSGMMSIGLNPTVNQGMDPRTIEVNIFDFDRDIYGSKIRVIYRFRLRDEMRFESISELTEQIDLDKKKALQLLN